MKNLFDIQAEYLQYLEELEEYFLLNPDAEGEIPEYINERLNINKNEVEDKLTNFYLWHLEIDNQIVALQERIGQLQKKLKSKKNTSERIKKYIADAVKLYGSVNLKSKAAIPSKTINGDNVKFTFIYNPSLNINNPEAIPDKYIQYNLDLKNLSEISYKNIVHYIQTREIAYKESTSINKKLLEQDLQDSEIPGVKYDQEAGYIKIT